MSLPKFITAVFTMLCLANACQEKIDPDNPDTMEKNIRLAVTLSPYSKAGMNSDGGLSWETGDEIGVWDGTEFQKVTLSSPGMIKNGSTAEFDITVSTKTGQLTVVFPYNENDVVDGDFVVTDAARVELGDSMKSQLKAFGVCTLKKPLAQLSNFNTIIRFSIDDDSVQGISIEGNDNETLLYRARINAKDGALSYSPESMEYRKLYLTNLHGKGEYYLGLLPDVSFRKGYTVKLFSKPSMTTMTLLATIRTTAQSTLKKGCFLDLGTLEFQKKEMSKTANCYVVETPGTYSISPVRGNSSDPVGEVASAEVLWETVNTAKAPAVRKIISSVSYDKSSGTISYTAASVKGNALIAAKDAAGNILWSWHIWNLLEPLKEIEIGGTKALDRNIGALSATGDLSSGLMFEWGRKDPFLGAAQLSESSVLMKATAKVNNAAGVTSDEQTGTIDYSIANPTTWIVSVQSNQYDWLYGGHDNNLWGQVKTIYDPCPAGYCVPDDYLWMDVYTAGLPLCGRFKASGRAWNLQPGSAGSYWFCSTKKDRGLAIIVDSDGKTSAEMTNKGVGCAVRCVKID